MLLCFRFAYRTRACNLVVIKALWIWVVFTLGWTLFYLVFSVLDLSFQRRAPTPFMTFQCVFVSTWSFTLAFLRSGSLPPPLSSVMWEIRLWHLLPSIRVQAAQPLVWDSNVGFVLMFGLRYMAMSVFYVCLWSHSIRTCSLDGFWSWLPWLYTLK